MQGGSLSFKQLMCLAPLYDNVKARLSGVLGAVLSDNGLLTNSPSAKKAFPSQAPLKECSSICTGHNTPASPSSESGDCQEPALAKWLQRGVWVSARELSLHHVLTSPRWVYDPAAMIRRKVRLHIN